MAITESEVDIVVDEVQSVQECDSALDGRSMKVQSGTVADCSTPVKRRLGMRGRRSIQLDAKVAGTD